MPRKAVANGTGAAVEVLTDGAWRRGRLVERVVGNEAKRWRVQFDDGELRDDIRLANPAAPDAYVRFDKGAYGLTVEVRIEGGCRRGRMVELVRGSDRWGVAFEDGGWAEDVLLGNPTEQYAFAVVAAGEKYIRKREREEGAEKHFCDTCGKTYSTSGNLGVHKRTHTGERPHACSICGKTYSRANDLAAHFRTHTGERPYVCETCGKGFNESGTLRVHMRTHTGEKPHVCTTCGKAFSQKPHLTKHVLTHTRETPHV
jgi:hypothetical protein